MKYSERAKTKRTRKEGGESSDSFIRGQEIHLLVAKKKKKKKLSQNKQ